MCQHTLHPQTSYSVDQQTFSLEEPYSKCLLLCRPDSLCHNYSSQPCHTKAAINYMQANGKGCGPTWLHSQKNRQWAKSRPQVLVFWPLPYTNTFILKLIHFTNVSSITVYTVFWEILLSVTSNSLWIIKFLWCSPLRVFCLKEKSFS